MGWRLVARLVPEEGGIIAYTAPDETAPLHTWTPPKKLKRRTSFVVLETETGEFRQVFKTELSELLEGTPQGIWDHLNRAKFTASNEGKQTSFVKKEQVFETRFVFAAALACSNWGVDYLTWEKAQQKAYLRPTKSMVNTVLNGSERAPIMESRAHQIMRRSGPAMDEAIARIKEVCLNPKPHEDPTYAQAVLKVIDSQYISGASVGLLVSSVAMIPEHRSEYGEDGKHWGAVGDSVRGIEGVLVQRKLVRLRTGPITNLTIKDAEGHLFHWYAKGEAYFLKQGNTYRFLKGVVKEHAEFNGTKVNELANVDTTKEKRVVIEM